MSNVKSKLKRVVDFLMGGPVPEPKPREIVLPPFHPIIFANGRDDDTEGLKAFWENRAVIYAGEEIKPGQSRELVGLELRLHCTAILAVHGDRVVDGLGWRIPPQGVTPREIRVSTDHGVKRVLKGCGLTFNCPVMP
ncbi:hypothetical protein [Sinorhizobium fredii]|uniref:hypothetical protein n=1 Tax=Rhizobium fredii TaxID=380 RepID=UPI0004B0CF61|nr:hypothetical protein [Sinorhizobium fredii]ASY69364.1 hypothetical protein SF83666_c19480 [Sinorhizobium fredii CCBAU 83666]